MVPRRVAANKVVTNPSVFDHSHHAYHRRTLSQHGAHIFLLWVVLLTFGFAGSLMVLTVATRLQALESQGPRVMDLEALVGQQELRLSQLVEAVKQLSPVPTQPSQPGMSTPQPGMPDQSVSMPGSVGSPVPAIALAPSSSPSGELSRGMLSPDGSKFAGYEDVKVGKKGIAVELIKDPGTRKERYIVIFNALTESTGIGTPSEKEMLVRWKDEKTIEYDVLVKVKNEWKKETRDVQIFF